MPKSQLVSTARSPSLSQVASRVMFAACLNFPFHRIEEEPSLTGLREAFPSVTTLLFLPWAGPPESPTVTKR
jgi:hypothetical protein